MFSLFENQVIKWGLVSGTTFTLETFLFLILFKFFKNLVIANLIAIGISTIYNFSMHNFWTFQDSDHKKFSLFRYLALLIISFILNTSLIHLFLYCKVPPLLSKIFSSLFTAPFNFIGLRKFVVLKST